MTIHDFLLSLDLKGFETKQKTEKELEEYLQIGMIVASNPVFNDVIRRRFIERVEGIFEALVKKDYEHAEALALSAQDLLDLQSGFEDMQKQIMDRSQRTNDTNSVDAGSGEDPYQIK